MSAAHHHGVLYILRRTLAAAALVWLVLSLTFLLVRAAPGDPAALLLPPTATAADAARMRAELGLDAPVAVQYARWAGGVLRGDLGDSFALHRPVSRVLADALPVTLFLGLTSLALTFVVGVVVGTVQAVRRGRASDTAITVATTAVYAAPSYWLSLALVALFTSGAARWGFPAALRLPAFGLRDPGGVGGGGAGALVDLARHAVLPVAVLAAVGAAGIARYARTSVGDVLDLDFVRTARAKGLAAGRVYGRHVLANALPPLIVLFALALPGVVAGSVFVESVFAWPGMGRALLTAIAARDYPVVMGVTALYATLVIAANLAADLALPLVDPRRRAS
ncbi:MAG TPA: ABC transporter permease [Gemmatimonadaceae bacterium]|nr:ABC transporter permease [Gemmatimonadaceae bacterium]